MFKTQNFCHIASNNRNQVKVGVFVYRTTDDLATVLTNGYFNERIIDINLHDLIIHEKVDNADTTKVERNLLCVTERTLENVGTTVIKNKWEGDIETEIATIEQAIENLPNIYVKKDGTSIMSAPLKFESGSMRGAVCSYLNGVSFWKMDSQGTITNIANLTDSQFFPVTTNSINLGNATHIWKDAYVARVITAVLNNGYDIAVPVTASPDTLALKSEVDLAANSGRMITDQGVWYAKMYAGTTAPAAEDGTNYADFSQTDTGGNPIIVIYERTSGAWVQSDIIVPPAEYDGYVPITSKIWDIAEQTGQQGGRVLWNHQSKEFTPYPQIVSFDNIEVTGNSTVIMPVNPSGNQIVNKDYVDAATAGSGYHPDLFDHKWADHILDDVQWLRADTFSWQDGGVYEAAYNHLVADLGPQVYGWVEPDSSIMCFTMSEQPEIGDYVYQYSGDGVSSTPIGTVTAVAADYSTITFGGMVFNRQSGYDTYFDEQSETVAGTKVFYYLAPDGHKICPYSQEYKVASIYAATGVAWYYILDTVNERFKLPRINPNKATLLDSSIPVVGTGYGITLYNGSSYWGIAHDADQSGTAIGATNQPWTTVGTGTSKNNSQSAKTLGVPTASQITSSGHTLNQSGLQADISSAASYFAGAKYLYFYVGSFTQTALENTAGLNAELFNDKADIDLANVLANIDYVVESQLPTAENNYIWYRKYRSGWVEQGQKKIQIAHNSKGLIALPVTMANTDYMAQAGSNQVNSSGTFGANSTVSANAGTTTEVRLGQSNSASASMDVWWEVKGMAA